MQNRTTTTACLVLACLLLLLPACGDPAETSDQQTVGADARVSRVTFYDAEEIAIVHQDDGVEAVMPADVATAILRFFDLRDLTSDEAQMTVLMDGVRDLVGPEATVTQQNQILIVRAQAKELVAIEAHLSTRRRTDPTVPKIKRLWTPIRDK